MLDVCRIMNEATLEAKISGELKRLFPLLKPVDLTHQVTFSLKLGRKSVQINFKRRYTKGRLDVLVSYKNKPFVILEIKSPSKTLTEDDRDQGISYARLITPMPPLVVVTNGNESHFYKTVDKQEWEVSTLDEAQLQGLIQHGLSLAAKDMDEAVHFLLGKDDDVWAKVIENITEEQIEQLKGDVCDFTHPIIRDYSIRREIVTEIENDLISGQKAIVLTGPPLSGKTNVFFQLCLSDDKKDLIYLYLNLSNIGYGPLQFLCNRFSKNLFLKKTTDDIRGWLIHSLRSPSDNRLVLIVDNWFEISENSTREEINELLDISKNSNISIVLSMTDAGFDLSKNYPGRTASIPLGQAKQHQLGYLNDTEFYSANALFEQKYSAIFEKGSEYSLLYRLPQTLRIISSKLQGDSSTSADKTCLIDSIPKIWLLDVVWQQINGNIELQGDMLKYARVFIESGNEVYKPLLKLIRHGWGGMELGVAEKYLGAERFTRLKEQGHLKMIRTGGDIIVMPTCTELVSAAASDLILAECENCDLVDLDRVYSYLINQSDAFPYGDLVGAKVLYSYASRNLEGFNKILQRIVDDEPRIEQPTNRVV